VEGRSWSPL